MALGLLGGLVSGVGAAMGAAQTAKGYDAQQKLQLRQAALEREHAEFELLLLEMYGGYALKLTPLEMETVADWPAFKFKFAGFKVNPPMLQP